jgi:adenylate kinase
MTLATIGTGIWSFLKRIPDWVLWTIAALVFLKFVDINAERRGRRKEAEKREREALEEMGRVNEAREQANTENHNAADRADEAVRTMPRHLPDELRDEAPDIADIVLGPRRGGT